MIHNVRRAARLADRNIALLITGETGTGKEAFARAVHESSARAAAPFVAVNCAAIPENLIESELFGYRQGAFTGARKQGMRGKLIQSSGGTLFLDEIGDMPYPLQTRLLRVLEDQTVTPLGSDESERVVLSVISATHRDLEHLVEAGAFREDLYYRLNGLTLSLPPLRERADRSQLIQQILRDESEGLGNVAISPAALRAMETYRWPGNIRQLRNALRTACALSEDGVVRLGDLPGELEGSSAVSEPGFDSPADDRVGQDAGALASAEKTALLHALEQSRWNVTQAARGLNISRNTLYRKLRKHGVKVSR
jgi:transcriptional regulator of acetoin/glycerol metabolism